jgi:hypothetical protein
MTILPALRPFRHHHNFVICSCCGDKRGTDADRDYLHPIAVASAQDEIELTEIEL